MKISIFQVDAFTSEILRKSCCSLSFNEWIPDDVMQKIAMENNLSETAFYIEDNDTYHIRWFTPKAELDLAGHLTSNSSCDYAGI